MQYEVTCNKCGRKFMITADGGEEMDCTCPYCSRHFKVSVPLVAKPVSEQTVYPTTAEEEEKSSHLGVTVLVVIFILLLAGAASYFGVMEWKRREAIARQEYLAGRRAHADSLRRVRAQEEATTKKAEQQEKQQQRVARFLVSFYQKAVIPYGDPSFYEQYLTPNCLQILYNGEERNMDVDKWTLWWGLFGMMNQSPNGEELVRNLAATPIADNWYKVRLSQQGETEFRQIKVQLSNGQVFIDDVR